MSVLCCDEICSRLSSSVKLVVPHGWLCVSPPKPTHARCYGAELSPPHYNVPQLQHQHRHSLRVNLKCTPHRTAPPPLSFPSPSLPTGHPRPHPHPCPHPHPHPTPTFHCPVPSPPPSRLALPPSFPFRLITAESRACMRAFLPPETLTIPGPDCACLQHRTIALPSTWHVHRSSLLRPVPCLPVFAPP